MDDNTHIHGHHTVNANNRIANIHMIMLIIVVGEEINYKGYK